METGSAIYADISSGHNRRVKTTGWQVERPTKHKVQNNLFFGNILFWGRLLLEGTPDNWYQKGAHINQGAQNISSGDASISDESKWLQVATKN